MTPGALDRMAVARGALVAAAVAVPAGIAQNLVGRGSSLSFALFVVTVLGLGAGGYVAAREALDRPLTTGGAAALAVYLAVQAIGVVLRLSRGEDVSWASIPLVALLSLSCGVIGGYVAFWRFGRVPVDQAGGDHTGGDDGDPTPDGSGRPANDQQGEDA